MPASPLPADQLDALAALVHSLNSPAAESAVPGDRAAGEQFFFGKGQCASCHMVYGRGEAVGPDLSSLAREMAVDEIRGALLEPSARVSPGYGLVTVHLQNGKSLRGFARSQSDYEVVVEDLEGRFHLLEGSQVSRIQEEKQSLMPPVKATPEELENLIAYLSRLTGAKTGTAKVEGRPEPGGISFSRILHPQPGDWLTYNGDLSGNRYSELAQINTTNVNTLGLKWIEGPARFNFDANLIKRVKITETKEFEFRVDAVSILNHPIFDPPTAQNMSIDSTSFGRITSASGIRRFTMGARLNF